MAQTAFLVELGIGIPDAGYGPAIRTVMIAFALGVTAIGSGNTVQGQEGPSQPVAIVEAIASETANVQVFEYLTVGQRIRLSSGEQLILGYLSSCVRETIDGGVTTIGLRQSSVDGGLVVREIVECDGGEADLSVAEASQSGVITFRAGADAVRGTRKNPIRVFSLTPAFVFADPVARLTIERLDLSGPPLSFDIGGHTLDLGDKGRSLSAGGVYEARAGEAVRVFKIAESARPRGALIGRIVRF